MMLVPNIAERMHRTTHRHLQAGCQDSRSRPKSALSSLPVQVRTVCYVTGRAGHRKQSASHRRIRPREALVRMP
eukprot:3571359-Rhodomonas_salina.4